jgi:hypothetical protein
MPEVFCYDDAMGIGFSGKVERTSPSPDVGDRRPQQEKGKGSGKKKTKEPAPAPKPKKHRPKGMGENFDDEF